MEITIKDHKIRGGFGDNGYYDWHEAKIVEDDKIIGTLSAATYRHREVQGSLSLYLYEARGIRVQINTLSAVYYPYDAITSLEVDAAELLQEYRAGGGDIRLDWPPKKWQDTALEILPNQYQLLDEWWGDLVEHNDKCRKVKDIQGWDAEREQVKSLIRNNNPSDIYNFLHHVLRNYAAAKECLTAMRSFGPRLL